MKLNIDLKTLKKMQTYLSSSQIATIVDAMIDYADYGTEYDFSSEKMNMIWDDLKPDLNRSKNSYSKWLKDRMAEEAERAKSLREGKVVKGKKSEEDYSFPY